MASDPSFPDLSVGEGWRLDDERVETLFRLPTMTVRGATRQYEDEATREAVRDAAGVDHRWRFVSATRLAFRPGLPPGVMAASILPTIRSEAGRSFTDRLRERGVDDIQRGRRERIRVGSGARARLTAYEGTTVAGEEIPVEGWVGVWYDRPDYFVVTGGYPAVRLAERLDVEDGAALERTPEEARTELVDAFRSVN